MKTADIKLELHNVIESAPLNELENMYGVLMNYLNGNNDEGWSSISQGEQQKTLVSLKQAEAKQGEALSVVSARLRKKYEDK